METGKLYLIKLQNSEVQNYGIVQAIGKEWILLYRVFSDYFVNGYLLIKEKYIESIIRNDKVKFKENVLIAKDINFILPPLNIPLDDTEQLLNWIEENKVTMMFTLKNDFVSYVGQINKILLKSFYLRILDVGGHWQKETHLFRIETIRTIEFETDYINSLLAYNLKKWPDLQYKEQ